MKTLEVEIDLEDPISLLRAVKKFVARDLIIDDVEAGELKGIIVARKGQKKYIFRSYPDKKTIEDRELDYRNLRKMQVINPREEDYRIARIGYREITNKTIVETIKWARKVRT